jgi:hypothetical protein
MAGTHAVSSQPSLRLLKGNRSRMEAYSMCKWTRSGGMNHRPTQSVVQEKVSKLEGGTA